jgi:calcineurin-like phosphoesterase family protein
LPGEGDIAPLSVAPRGHQIKGMTVFFTSDTHFGHAGVIFVYKRPFASVAEMDRAMIARWNETVGPDDEVWHLGDFAIRQPEARVAEILAQLNGVKHLVAGNNDPDATRRQPAWASVRDYAEIEVDGTSLVLCHYPFRTWRNSGKGAVDLHGHSHGRLAPMTRQYDVGVDVWDFRPVTLATILSRRRRRTAGAAAKKPARAAPARRDGQQPSLKL